MENSQKQVKERIRNLMELKGLNFSSMTNEFSSIANKNNNLRVKLTRQIKGTTSLSCDVLLYILVQFPDLSSEWLMRGIGDMEIKAQNTLNNKELEDLKSQNAMLIETNRNLSRMLQNTTQGEKLAAG